MPQLLEEFARGVGAIDLEPLGLGMANVEQAEIVKQRRHVQQLGVELQFLTNAFHRAEQEDADRMVEHQLGFVLPHQLGGFTRNSAVGNPDAGNHVVLLLVADQVRRAPGQAAFAITACGVLRKLIAMRL